MSYLIVPSDITVLENKICTGTRSLGFLERAGLAGIFPLYHNSFSKLSKHEMRAVLTKKYPNDHSCEADLCKARQDAVHRQVVAHNGFWAGALGFGAGTGWSLRFYRGKVGAHYGIMAAMTYVGACVGRACGDILSGRNGETYRDRYLANLPATIYYPGGES